MQVVITAVGPDNSGLADPIIHHVTTQGANIAEIQMYDHDEEAIFAMLCRINIDDPERFPSLRDELLQIGNYKNLSVRVWSPDLPRKPRLAICTTYRPEPALAVLRGIRDKQIPAEAALMLGNRKACRGIAEQFGVDWHFIGDGKGNPDENRMVELFDEYEIDYVLLARYMRVLPASTCWKFAGGRIVNSAPRLTPWLSWNAPLSRRIRFADADLRGNMPLHRARIGRRKSNCSTIDFYGSTWHAS